MPTSQELRDYAAKLDPNWKPNAQGVYDVPDDGIATNIYAHAASNGYSAKDLGAFGWDENTVNSTSDRLGLKRLTGPAPTPTPAPAPPPYTPGTPSAPPPAANTYAPPTQSLYGYSAANAPKAPAYTAQQPGQSGSAQQVAWDESKSTAGRLNSMLASGSPLMQAAELRGNQAAARRGLMGSSMGVQAAQKAMIDAATPIAAQDASLFSQQAIANMAQANGWNIADLQRALQDKQFASSLGLSYDQLQEQARQFQAGLGVEGAKLGESARVADMNYSMADKRLTQEDRQFLGTYNLKSRELDQQMEQFAKTYGLSVQELDMRKDQLSQQDRQFYDGLKLQRDQLTQQASQFNQEWQNRFSLEGMAQANRIDLANIDAQNKQTLMAMEAGYRSDIASNENISQAWGTMMQAIGNIQNNPDIDADTKRTLIQNNINGFGAFTSFWKKATGGTVDVSDLLNFGVGSVTGSGSGTTGKPVGGTTETGGAGAGDGGSGDGP